MNVNKHECASCESGRTVWTKGIGHILATEARLFARVHNEQERAERFAAMKCWCAVLVAIDYFARLAGGRS